MSSAKSTQNISSASYAALAMALLAGHMLYRRQDTPTTETEVELVQQVFATAVLPDARSGCGIQRFVVQPFEERGSCNARFATSLQATDATVEQDLLMTKTPLRPGAISDMSLMFLLALFIILAAGAMHQDSVEMAKEEEHKQTESIASRSNSHTEKKFFPLTLVAVGGLLAVVTVAAAGSWFVHDNSKHLMHLSEEAMEGTVAKELHITLRKANIRPAVISDPALAFLLALFAMLSAPFLHQDAVDMNEEEHK